MSTRIRDRYSFANIEEALPLPDLVAIQRESFKWFLEKGLKETFADISPIKDFTETLQLELEFDPDDEDLRPPPKFSVEECKEKDMTFSAPIFVRARFSTGRSLTRRRIASACGCTRAPASAITASTSTRPIRAPISP